MKGWRCLRRHLTGAQRSAALPLVQPGLTTLLLR